MVQQVLDLSLQLKYIEKTKDNRYLIRLKQEKQLIKKDKSSFKKAISIFYNHYVNLRDGKKPYIAVTDYRALKKLLKDFTLEEFDELVPKYLILNDTFLKDNAYSLRFMPANINKIINRKQERIDFTSSAVYEMSDEQVKMYHEGVKSGKYTGKEEWEMPYIEEVIKRGFDK